MQCVGKLGGCWEDEGGPQWVAQIGATADPFWSIGESEARA